MACVRTMKAFWRRFLFHINERWSRAREILFALSNWHNKAVYMHVFDIYICKWCMCNADYNTSTWCTWFVHIRTSALFRRVYRCMLVCVCTVNGMFAANMSTWNPMFAIDVVSNVHAPKMSRSLWVSVSLSHFCCGVLFAQFGCTM